MPNPVVWVAPKAGVAGLAKELPNGVAVVVPKPVVCPKPVLVVGWPKSLFCENRLVVCVAVGVEKENPVFWAAPKPAVGCVGLPKREPAVL